MNEMGGAYITYKGEDGRVRGFRGETLREKGHFKNIRGRLEDNIKLDIQEMGWGHVIE